MPLLAMPTREQVDPEVRTLWDECERVYPAFKHLWATQANSPIIFRHVWGQLLELKRRSPVAARHFEIGIVVASAPLVASTSSAASSRTAIAISLPG